MKNQLSHALEKSLMCLTESDVSNCRRKRLYFAHPDSKYFGLGKITMEQVEDLAKRKGRSTVEMARWLGSVIY